jgi:hypothetical protein
VTFPLVRDYVHWHVNSKHQRATVTLRTFFACLKTFSHTYKPDKEFHDALSQLHLTLPRPERVYNKEDAWLSLERLGQVATALWPKKQPGDFKHGGARSAMHAGLSLTLHLLCTIPYRQRNIREMELGKNLYQTTQGEWRIRFAGEQLKIARKDGQENVFDLCFPKHLVPLLEQYLSAWRPILIARRGTPSPLVFPNSEGKAYTAPTFTQHVQSNVYRFTGKAFHPHLIRTIWATTYIRQTGDLYTAAIMLNDKLATVVNTYAHLNEQGAAEKAYHALQGSYNLTPLPALPPPAVTDPIRASRIRDLHEPCAGHLGIAGQRPGVANEQIRSRELARSPAGSEKQGAGGLSAGEPGEPRRKERRRHETEF